MPQDHEFTGKRGDTICTLSIEQLFWIVRERFKRSMPARSDPDTFAQQFCVAVEKAMGIFPNIPAEQATAVVGRSTPKDGDFLALKAARFLLGPKVVEQGDALEIIGIGHWLPVFLGSNALCGYVFEARKEPESDVAQIDWDSIPRPAERTLWEHRSGRIYMVLFVTNLNGEGAPRAKYPPTVVYMGLTNGKLWSGRLDDWSRRMKPYNPL